MLAVATGDIDLRSNLLPQAQTEPDYGAIRLVI